VVHNYGYAGITTDYDVQASSDDYFAYVSILQIQTNLATKTCPTKAMISNNSCNKMLEQITLFLRDCICVKRTGTDATGDVLTYTGSKMMLR
jgi:hypothetical protein